MMSKILLETNSLKKPASLFDLLCRWMMLFLGISRCHFLNLSKLAGLLLDASFPNLREFNPVFTVLLQRSEILRLLNLRACWTIQTIRLLKTT